MENYEFERDLQDISHYNKRVLTFMVCYKLVKCFENGMRCPTSTSLSHELEIPIRMVNEILNDLIECGMVSEIVTENSQENGYQPAVDINKISVSFLYQKLEHKGNANLSFAQTNEAIRLQGISASLLHEIEKSESNILLKDI
ncbi:MAG: hypothetical protein HC896_13285 [Bacteroidales bacterium]|nr:hypothetical protein [Bacteroidales bacterium]